MKIKQDQLNIQIYCPLTNQKIMARFIDPQLYQYYSDKGYNFLFEEDIQTIENIEEIIEIKETKKKK